MRCVFLNVARRSRQSAAFASLCIPQRYTANNSSNVSPDKAAAPTSAASGAAAQTIASSPAQVPSPVIADATATAQTPPASAATPPQSLTLGSEASVNAGFDKWCAEEGLLDITAADFIRGATQAYRALGVILSAAAQQSHKVVHSGPRFQNACREVMYERSSMLSTQGPLPFTKSFCGFVNQALAHHGDTLNIYRYAAPNDLVVHAALSKFVVSDVANAEVDELQDDPQAATSTAVGINNLSSSGTSLDKDAAAKAKTETSTNGDVTERVSVVVAMYVVVPPQRFFSAYDFFYSRMTGTETENERVAVARLFAASGVGWFAKFFDGLIRAVSGANAEFMYTKTLGSMLGLPENIDQCPPCKKKLLTFQLSADRKRWLLSTIENAEEAHGKPYPNPDAAPS